MPSTIDSIESSVQKANEWIRDVAEELGEEDRQHGYVALRAALHTLRDRLTVEQSAHLSAQLPLVVRGIFFEGWNPAHVPVPMRSKDDFVSAVEEALHDAAPSLKQRPAEVALATFHVLAHRIDEGEAQKLQSSLPKALRTLWM